MNADEIDLEQFPALQAWVKANPKAWHGSVALDAPSIAQLFEVLVELERRVSALEQSPR